MNSQISLPSWLHSLHGEQSRVADVLLTHLVGWGITALVFGLGFAAGYPWWVNVLLAVLAIDIAGGVVSNMTQGTNAYYSARPSKRVTFLRLHLIQPAVLMLLFPAELILTGLTAASALGVAFAINAAADRSRMKVQAISYATVALTLLLLFPADFSGLTLILVLYILKVALAFPVDWYKE
jgi:hypothetical protein